MVIKFLHIADLHIGKRLNEFNLIEDQKYILDQILEIAQKNDVDGMLIAGDVYDKSQPTAEAVELLDNFLTKLTAANLSVFMISGNHDSPERLSFGNRIMQKNGLHIAGGFQGKIEKVTLNDAYGSLHIYLLPFLKPAQVRPFFEIAIENYDQAIQAVLTTGELNTQERNILVAHQFVVSGSEEPQRSDSETISVGGLDSVDASAFRAFDYVALGHLHQAQSIGLRTVRYGGSPLKYSFSEARQAKSATILDVGPKGELSFEQIPLNPLRDLREIKGPINELLRLGKEDRKGAQDYLRITLTDEEEIYDALGLLRPIYPNVMILDFENSRSASVSLNQSATTGDITRKSPIELFAGFYQLQNNNELSEEQIQVLEAIFDEAGVDEL